MSTKQLDLWKSEFGREYADRNAKWNTPENSRKLFKAWSKLLKPLVSPYPKSVLEVGCNFGSNLMILKELIEQIHGIEPNKSACELAKKNFSNSTNVEIQNGDGFNLPFADSSMDLVFTAGVLIHVAPEDLGKMVDEIVRVSKHYVLAVEYFSHEPASVPYRGMDGFLFKRDFGKFYAERHPNLQLVDYGFLWQPVDAFDNSNWWLFRKS